MRVWSRVALVLGILLSASIAVCRSLSGRIARCRWWTPRRRSRTSTSRRTACSAPPATPSTCCADNVLTTYTANDVGNLTIAREDFLGLAARGRPKAASRSRTATSTSAARPVSRSATSRNTRAGGTAPVRRSHHAGLHYRRLTASGNRLAGLYPATDLPCYPLGATTPLCVNSDRDPRRHQPRRAGDRRRRAVALPRRVPRPQRHRLQPGLPPRGDRRGPGRDRHHQPRRRRSARPSTAFPGTGW